MSLIKCFNGKDPSLSIFVTLLLCNKYVILDNQLSVDEIISNHQVVLKCFVSQFIGFAKSIYLLLETYVNHESKLLLTYTTGLLPQGCYSV